MAPRRHSRWLRAKRYDAFPNVRFPSPLRTQALIVLAVVAFVLSVVSAALNLVVILTNEISYVRNSANVVYAARDNSVEARSITLIPQFDVSIGLLSFCITGRCFSRSAWNALPFLGDVTALASGLPSNVQSAFKAAVEDGLMFGYAMGAHCGTTQSSIQARSVVAFTSLIVSFVSSAILLCELGAYFAAVTAYDPVRDPHWDHELHDSPSAVQKRYVAKIVRTSKWLTRMQRKLRVVVMATALFSLLWLTLALGLVISLVHSAQKCGDSVCSAYRSSMAALLDVVGGDTGSVSCGNSHGYSCLIASFIIMIGVTVCTVANLLLEECSMKDEVGPVRWKQLRQLVEPVAKEDTHVVGDDVRQEGGARGTPVARCILGAVQDDPLAEFLMAEPDAMRGDDEGLQGRAEPLMLCSHQETAQRYAILAKEDVRFSSIRLMARKAWRNERLSLVHLWSLYWHLGPQLDIHLEETYLRQCVLGEYHHELRQLLWRVETGSRHPEAAYAAEAARKQQSPLRSWMALASGASPAVQRGWTLTSETIRSHGQQHSHAPPTEQWLACTQLPVQGVPRADLDMHPTDRFTDMDYSLDISTFLTEGERPHSVTSQVSSIYSCPSEGRSNRKVHEKGSSMLREDVRQLSYAELLQRATRPGRYEARLRAQLEEAMEHSDPSRQNVAKSRVTSSLDTFQPASSLTTSIMSPVTTPTPLRKARSVGEVSLAHRALNTEPHLVSTSQRDQQRCTLPVPHRGDENGQQLYSSFTDFGTNGLTVDEPSSLPCNNAPTMPDHLTDSSKEWLKDVKLVHRGGGGSEGHQERAAKSRGVRHRHVSPSVL